MIRTSSVSYRIVSLGCFALALATNACSSTSAGSASAASGASTSASSGTSSAQSTSASTGPSGPVSLYTFDTAADIESAQIANSASTDPNDLTVSTAATSFDGAVGDPDTGSLKITMPCTTYGQFVDYQFIFQINQDLGDKILSVKVRLDEGFSPDASAPGSITLYAKSGDNWDWGQATTAAIGPDSIGQWKEYSFAMSNPDPGSSSEFDPGQLRAIGIKLDTGLGPASKMPPPALAVFHIDSIGYR